MIDDLGPTLTSAGAVEDLAGAESHLLAFTGGVDTFPAHLGSQALAAHGVGLLFSS